MNVINLNKLSRGLGETFKSVWRSLNRILKEKCFKYKSKAKLLC